MPSRNSIKIYVEDSFYHIYNRGVEKRIIFTDEQDYKVFLSYLKQILSPQPKGPIKTIINLRGQSYEVFKSPLKNYSDSIELCAYCLMPNHFHFLIKQKNRRDMEGFMRSLMTRYSKYFNKKYDRVGSLFQGRYKASVVETEEYLLHLSRYIHTNPSENLKNLVDAYSSYGDYLGVRNTSWVKTKEVLSYFNKKILPDFKKINSYKKFVEEYLFDSTGLLGDLTLE